jgi:hypothetical protein
MTVPARLVALSACRHEKLKCLTALNHSLTFQLDQSIKRISELRSNVSNIVSIEIVTANLSVKLQKFEDEKRIQKASKQQPRTQQPNTSTNNNKTIQLSLNSEKEFYDYVGVGTYVSYRNRKGKWVQGNVVSRVEDSLNLYNVLNNHLLQSQISIDNIKLHVGSIVSLNSSGYWVSVERCFDTTTTTTQSESEYAVHYYTSTLSSEVANTTLFTVKMSEISLLTKEMLPSNHTTFHPSTHSVLNKKKYGTVLPTTRLLTTTREETPRLNYLVNLFTTQRVRTDSLSVHEFQIEVNECVRRDNKSENGEVDMKTYMPPYTTIELEKYTDILYNRGLHVKKQIEHIKW